MFHLVEAHRAYPPETVAVMTAAFHRTCQSLPKSIKDYVRRKLALIIIRALTKGSETLCGSSNLLLEKSLRVKAH
jgi:hypothetical protein